MKKLVAIILCAAMLCSFAIASADVTPMKWEDQSQFPLVASGEDVTITALATVNDTYHRDAEDTWWWPWLESITGVTFDIETVTSAALSERRNLMLASGDLPDLMYGMYFSTSDLVTYGQMENMFLDLTPYINEEYMPYLSELIEYNYDVIGSCITPDGKIYTLPYVNLNSDGQSNLFFLNKVMLEAAGMDIPQTLDEFIAYLYACKEIDPDCIPLAGCASEDQYHPFGYILNAMGYLGDSYDIGTGVAIRNGEAVIPAADDLFIEALTLFHQFYVDGIISQDYYSLDKTAVDAQITELKTGTQQDYLYAGDFNNWVSATPLTSAWNDTKQWRASSTVSVGGVAVSADTENADVIMKLLDFWYSPMGMELSWIGPAVTMDYGMGIIQGYDIDPETGAYAWLDVNSGLCENTLQYVSYTSDVSNALGNQGIWPSRPDLTDVTQRRMVVAGYEPISVSYDVTTRDGYFRASMLENVSPYEVSGYPYITYWSEDESNRMNELSSVLVPYMQGEIAKFITGARDLSEFDAYLQELETMGIDEYLGFFQTAWAAYNAAK